MAVIPRDVYDACEQKLYQRAQIVEKASEKLMFARSMADSVGSSMPAPLDEKTAKRRGVNPNAIHGSGGKGDQVERAAFAIIQAEAELCTALKWAEVFSRLDEIFAGKPEAEIADDIEPRAFRQSVEDLHESRCAHDIL